MRPARPLAIAVVTSSLLAAACTGDDDDVGIPPQITDPPESTSPPTTTIPPPSPNDPLVLGLLLPEVGDNPLAISLRDGADAAVQDARSAGAEIRVVSEAEGGTRAETADAINRLADQDVNAVVGPSSSITALNTLDLLVDAGIPTCSPTASSLLLDDFPDDELFMRTIPSDSLQAQAIAQLASSSGAGAVAVAYVDDHYGRGLNEATVNALNALNLTVHAHVPIPDETDELGGAVDDLVADGPGALIVLGDGEHGMQFLTALDEHLADNPSAMPTARGVIVNDALRQPQPRDAMAGLSDQLRDRIRGVSPVAAPPSTLSTTSDLVGSYSLNSYNCVTAFAFAWHVAAMQERHLSIPLVAEITNSGLTCASYNGCVQAFEANPMNNIHYWGPGAHLALGPNGDPAEAQFDVFEFDENGTDVPDNRTPIRVP